ncbi:hypothetical protein GCM10010293_30350 [Streptomyces griseoflavus]|nr:hypothetical protein GCM10010293_30350 [Streptomyces griseoflavus]
MPKRARTSVVRTALGAVVSTCVQPPSGSVSAATAASADTPRNPEPGLLIFLVRKGMAGLYKLSIHGTYSPIRVPVCRSARACESRHGVRAAVT